MYTSTQLYNCKKSPSIKCDNETNNNKTNNKKFDGIEVGNAFITYFYSAWKTNIDVLILEDIIKPYSKIKYNSILFEGNDFLLLLKTLASNGIDFTDCKYEIMDSGSRQIYILVTGIITNSISVCKFSQSFMISYMGENNIRDQKKWTLMNSVLIM